MKDNPFMEESPLGVIARIRGDLRPREDWMRCQAGEFFCRLEDHFKARIIGGTRAHRRAHVRTALEKSFSAMSKESDAMFAELRKLYGAKACWFVFVRPMRAELSKAKGAR
jgi:hypothetical protein